MNLKYLLVNGWDVKFINKMEVPAGDEFPGNENAVKIQKGKVRIYFKAKHDDEDEVERWYEDAGGWEVTISTLARNMFVCQQMLHVGPCDIEDAINRIWERPVTVGEMLTLMVD
jgi:hypothetical protein